MHKIFERFLPAALRGPRAGSAGPVPAPFVRVGCDVVAIPDVQRALDRFGDRYLSRVFGLSGALSRYESSPQHLAGKFAAMEAVAKVLDVRATSVALGDIEIVNSPSGRPGVLLHGQASEVARALGVQAWDVSISHEADTAFAVAVATGIAGRGGQAQETQRS